MIDKSGASEVRLVSFDVAMHAREYDVSFTVIFGIVWHGAIILSTQVSFDRQLYPLLLK